MASYANPKYGPPDPWQWAIPKPQSPAGQANPWTSAGATEFPNSRENTNAIPGGGVRLPGFNGEEQMNPDTRGQGGAPPQQNNGPYDPTIDYLLGQKDQDMKRRRSARDEQVKRKLLAFGSRELARKYFGDSDPFTQMVSDDPAQSNSWMAEAKRRLQQTLTNTTSMLGNQYGLWNSSGRTEELGNVGRDYTSNVAQQTSGLEDELSGLDRGISDAEAEWMQRIFDARRTAWQAGATNSGF